MSDISANLALPYLAPSQAQKHVTHNEALQILDAVAQLSVVSRTETTPPVSPAEGTRHIVPAAATGDWSGQDDHVALWNGSVWLFLAPRTGWRAWVEAENTEVHWQGTSWDLTPGVDNLTELGVNATADSVNRLAVAADATLLNHDGAGHQVKVNKAAANEDAGVVFQTGYATHALFGLLGNDDFALKVSPDGSSFADAINVEAATGEVNVAQGLRLGGGDLLTAYEQGTWTPDFGASTTDPTGAAFSSSGIFMRIGKLVFLTFELAVSNRGTGGAGNVQIQNLPFVSSGNFYSADLRHAGIVFPGSGAPIMRSSGTTLSLFSTNGSDMLWSNLPSSSNFSLLGSFIYMHNG